MKRKTDSLRWAYLILGVLALLVAGVVYAWSILKAPLAEAFGWSGSELALNFTLTMCFFCLGGFAGGLLSRRLGDRLCLFLAAGLSGLGFLLASRLGGKVLMLYISYGILAGFGIGLAYNVIISAVSAWFPDKKGLCSGALMMGFGASALVIGKLASALIDGPGGRGFRAEGLFHRTDDPETFLLAGFLLHRMPLRRGKHRDILRPGPGALGRCRGRTRDHAGRCAFHVQRSRTHCHRRAV